MRAAGRFTPSAGAAIPPRCGTRGGKWGPAQGLEGIRTEHEKLRTEVATLVQSEHYSAVITGVERNGKTRVKLHIPGMSPVRQEVHPDVPLEQIRVGAEGFVSKARNCLLEISRAEPEWPDMGTFEERLPDGHAW